MSASTEFRKRTLVYLLLLSALFSGALAQLHLPAGTLLGCMLAGMVLALREAAFQAPRSWFVAAQGVIGVLVARNLPLATFGEMARHWPVFVLTVCSVIAISTLLSWVLMKARVLPGTTAVWGLAPGAATAMILMAEEFGGDPRLVALMHYLRILLVTLLATAITWIATPTATAHTLAASAPAWHAGNLFLTLCIGVGGAALGQRLRIPAGALVVPLVLGLALGGSGIVRLELHPALLTLAYALIGWSVGLRFTRQILMHAWRAIPAVLASTLVLILTCVLLAGALVLVTGIDPLTAYLATSPGGADSIAIIASVSPVDAPFIMAIQFGRFFTVLLLGPRISRLIAQHALP